MLPRVILFTFAGRRPNMELQIQWVQRILARHPNVEWHIWNLARNLSDAIYLQTLAGPRITVNKQFYRRGNLKFRDVYRHYAHPQYQDCLFVKIDDDIVYAQTDRFGDYLNAINTNRDTIISANVINNAACARTQPGLWQQFTQLDIPLLDWHKHHQTAEIAHQYLFNNHDTLLTQNPKLIPTRDWLSINMIGYDHPTAVLIAQHIGTPAPPLIAGRPFTNKDKLGDEGVINRWPRTIMQGFTAAHLTFGMQNPTPEQLTQWRERYNQLNQTHLKNRVPA